MRQDLSPPRGETYYLPANPVIGVIKGVSFPLKQLSEKCPQVFIVRLLKEVQPPHITQVGGHLLWNPRRLQVEVFSLVHKQKGTYRRVASYDETFEKNIDLVMWLLPHRAGSVPVSSSTQPSYLGSSRTGPR